MASVSDKPMLLIVDDEQNFTESLQLAIEDEFTVFVAGSLEGARTALKRIEPAAVLLDLRLPDGDGLEFFRDLNKLAKLPVVIVMTAYTSMESIVQAFGEGAVDYYTKPLNIGKLKLDLKRNIESKTQQK